MFDCSAIRRFSADIRISTIRSLERAGFGHIGGSMSIADVLAVLYGGMMRIDPAHPDWSGRDYFVLSKGHCGPALYAALALKGYFPMDWLDTVNQPGYAPAQPLRPAENAGHRHDHRFAGAGDFRRQRASRWG